MARDKNTRAAGKQLIQNCHGKRAALLRIGTAAEFVEENKTFLIRRFQEFPDGAHIGGKSRKRAVERLLISDGAADIPEYRKPRFFSGKYRPAGLVQQDKEGGGF